MERAGFGLINVLRWLPRVQLCVRSAKRLIRLQGFGLCSPPPHMLHDDDMAVRVFSGPFQKLASGMSGCVDGDWAKVEWRERSRQSLRHLALLLLYLAYG